MNVLENFQSARNGVEMFEYFSDTICGISSEECTQHLPTTFRPPSHAKEAHQKVTDSTMISGCEDPESFVGGFVLWHQWGWDLRLQKEREENIYTITC